MRRKGKICQISWSFIIFLCLMLIASAANAELSIQSVTPDQGVTGQDLAVTITGTGFDENIRIFIYMDRMLSLVGWAERNPPMFSKWNNYREP